MKRVYGAHKTHLILTGKALDLYSGSDPFIIYEYEIDGPEDDDGYSETEYRYSYSAWGDPETPMMSKDELVRRLESLYDDINSIKKEDITMNHYESMSKETLQRKYDALPLDIRDGVEAFWEAGFDYDAPDFWDSYDPAPDPAFVEAVQMYDALQK